MSDTGSIFQREPGTQAVPAPVPPAPLVLPRAQVERSPGVGFAAAVAAAAAGGLLWAGVVIVTNIDFGILAWFLGAATGFALVRGGGGAGQQVERVAAGVLAAAGIVLGKYVIFVHAVKADLHRLYPNTPIPVGYLDSTQMSIFIHHVGEIFKPIYIVWLAFAFFGAYRVSGGATPLPRRSRS